MTVVSAVFFFSSRRRHTRLVSDWSSDVCLPISAGLARERIAEQAAVRSEDLVVALAEPVEQPGRALDVGEEKGRALGAPNLGHTTIVGSAESEQEAPDPTAARAGPARPADVDRGVRRRAAAAEAATERRPSALI